MFCIWAGPRSCLIRFFRRRLPARIVFVVVPERRLKHMFALAANEVPSNPVVVAAKFRVDQEPLNRVHADRFKKILCARARPKRSPRSRPAFIEGMQYRVLLFSRQTGEFGSAREYLFHSSL